MDRTRLRSAPAFRQIRDRIAVLIDEGTLRPGERLPPTRTLAKELGVHRSTAVRAYEELRALGYLESRSGSYSTVRQRSRPPATSAEGKVESGGWLRRATRGATAVRKRAGLPGPPSAGEGGIDLARLSPDPSLLPIDALQSTLRTALRRDGPAALGYAEPSGWGPLRELISTRLRAHGIAASADEVLITAGAQQAIDLCLRMLTRPGDRVVVEAPTYGMLHPLLRLHGLEVIEVPMRPSGMDLDALEASLARASPKLLYTMPSFHNPTGISTAQAHRERLLAACEGRGVPVIEDGFEEELRYFGQAVLPIKSVDARGLVLYVGTFSKVMFPGLRIGWIAASPDAIDLLSSMQHAVCLAPNTLAQATLARFCQSGEYELHLRRIHRIYRRRMEALLDGLETFLPRDVEWTRPSGGYTAWLRLPGRVADEHEWCRRFERAGVLVAPGRQFFGRPPRGGFARLSIACVDELQISAGCRALGNVLR